MILEYLAICYTIIFLRKKGVHMRSSRRNWIRWDLASPHDATNPRLSQITD